MELFSIRIQRTFQLVSTLKDASIIYLSKNLRTCGVCKIALDIPKTGDYHFKCMKNDPESDLDSTN